jgi:hypothetical protein
MPAKSPNPATPDVAEEDTQEVMIDISKAVITSSYAMFITIGGFEVGLRRRTLLDDLFFQEVIRRVAHSTCIAELNTEFGYDPDLIDKELTEFLWHSSQIAYAKGVDYITYKDDVAAIKRKFVAYISAPDIYDLWAEINKAINALARNPDPITAPGVVTTDPKS